MKNNFIPDRRKFKTADDFLRWLDEKKADKKKAEEQAIRRSAMVWADDGGRLGETSEENAPPGE